MGRTREVAFGIQDHTELRDGVPLSQLFAERLELLEHADQAEFYGYHTTEHHLSPLDGTPSPLVFLAAASQRTERIRLCSLVLVLPLYDPLRVAEEVIMVDHLTDGRLEIGVGKGISPPEHRMFGSAAETAKPRFEERLEEMISVFLGNPVTGADIPFSPVQKPYPPIWYAGNGEYAGGRNMHAIVGGPPAIVAASAAAHRAALADPPAGALRVNPAERRPKAGFARHVFVDRDGDRARRRAIQAWSRYDTNLRTHFVRCDEPVPNGPTLDGDGELALELGILAAGTPDEVAANLTDVFEAADVDYVNASLTWGDLDHREAMGSLELYATEVMPRVKAAVAAMPVPQ